MTRRDRLMKHPPLPPRDAQLLLDSDSPPRLIRHLEIVHGTCCRLLDAFRDQFPQLPLDADTICLGAAIHDVGKLIHPEELSSAGPRHEEDGPGFSYRKGISSRGRPLRPFSRPLGRRSASDARRPYRRARRRGVEGPTKRPPQVSIDTIPGGSLDGVIEEITTNVYGQLRSVHLGR